MTKKTFTHLLICLSSSLVSWSVDAHQSVLSYKSAHTAKAPYIIEEPEISKAIFSELTGKPHYYCIDSDSKFKSNRVYKEGTYYLRIFNRFNTGRYVLAVDDTESFPFTVIVRMLFTMPKINSAFWDDVNCSETKKDD